MDSPILLIAHVRCPQKILAGLQAGDCAVALMLGASSGNCATQLYFNAAGIAIPFAAQGGC